MNTDQEVMGVPHRKRTVWFFVGLAVVGVAATAVHVAYRGTLALADMWTFSGVFVALVGLALLRGVTAGAEADEYGLHSGTFLRRRSVPWRDVADLRVRVRYVRGNEIRRVSALLRDGREMLLVLPVGFGPGRADFDVKLEELRALHRSHGGPASDHVVVISSRTAGGGHLLGALALCVLFLTGAGWAASLVGPVAAHQREWRSAAPCTASTPAAERDECLTTVPAVIASVEAGKPKNDSWLYLRDARPTRRVEVSREAARAFRPGDGVELTVWRHRVMVVAGAHYVWHEHVVTPGSVAVFVGLLGLAAGYPAAVALQHLRARRRPDDEALPSPLPYAGVLVVTALWLLPFCYFHGTTPLPSWAEVGWPVAGSAVTVALLVVVWRATGVVVPGDAEVALDTGESGEQGEAVAEDEGEEVFLPARFLDHTEYNPHGFGTHIVVGGGPLAVTPHAGPGRFAARTIPVNRLTVRNVRRARGDEADIVSGSWHVAELDDAGETVRLAAAPDDLARILSRLGATRTPVKN